MATIRLPDGHVIACQVDDFTDPWTSDPETVLFLQRLLLHYGIYRRYPLKPWPAFKNAWRIAFR